MKLSLASTILFAAMLSLHAPAAALAQAPASAPSPTSQSPILTPAEASKVLPPTVFFRGLSAPIQARNSTGIRLSDKALLLIGLVDTSGYSTQVKEKYQAYLITESAITIDGHTLAPGAYGCGFIADDIFLVQDIGAHDLFTAHSTRDAALHRPMPLQILAAPDEPGSYRLYAGRSYVTLHIAAH